MVYCSDFETYVYLLSYRKTVKDGWLIIDTPFIVNTDNCLFGEMISSTWYKSILKCSDTIEYIIFKIKKREYNLMVTNSEKRKEILNNILHSHQTGENDRVVMRHKITPMYLNSIGPKLKNLMKAGNETNSTIATTMANDYGELSMTFSIDKNYNIHVYCPRFKISL
tara:strand:- start:111 stop:611 length:501 start_codon:yes stop_codon:yes gene_type:complete